MVFQLVLLVFPAAMALAACCDFFTMKIPNALTVGFGAAFFIVAPFAGLSLAEMSVHLSAGLAMLALGFGLFCLGWIGGGDAKFFAATALWLGWEQLLPYAILFSLLGGALTIALLLTRRWPLPSLLGRAEWALRLHDSRSGIPYGVALAVAGILLYPQTAWMTTLAA